MSDLDWEFDEVFDGDDDFEEIVTIGRNDFEGLYFLVQKMVGVILILLSVIACCITRDGTGPAVLIAFGLVLIFTREKVLWFGFGSEYDDDF